MAAIGDPADDLFHADKVHSGTSGFGAGGGQVCCLGSRVLVVVTDAGRFGVRQLKLAGADPGDVIMSLTAREARKILQRDSEKRWSISF